MRVFLIASLVVTAMHPVESRGDDGDVKKKAELKWARSVADDFLKALKKKDDASVEALLTAAYAKLLNERDFRKTKPGQELTEGMPGFDKATITVEEISPDRDDAAFKGQLSSSRGSRVFTIRVVKDKESAHWRVGLLLLDEEKPLAKPANPKQ